jgi:phospholipase C
VADPKRFRPISNGNFGRETLGALQASKVESPGREKRRHETDARFRANGIGPRSGGSRIPTIVFGAMVKKGYVDSTMHDTTSILKFITRAFELGPLPGVRANVADLTNAIDLNAIN